MTKGAICYSLDGSRGADHDFSADTSIFSEQLEINGTKFYGETPDGEAINSHSSSLTYRTIHRILELYGANNSKDKESGYKTGGIIGDIYSAVCGGDPRFAQGLPADFHVKFPGVPTEAQYSNAYYNDAWSNPKFDWEVSSSAHLTNEFKTSLIDGLNCTVKMFYDHESDGYRFEGPGIGSFMYTSQSRSLHEGYSLKALRTISLDARRCFEGSLTVLQDFTFTYCKDLYNRENPRAGSKCLIARTGAAYNVSAMTIVEFCDDIGNHFFNEPLVSATAIFESTVGSPSFNGTISTPMYVPSTSPYAYTSTSQATSTLQSILTSATAYVASSIMDVVSSVVSTRASTSYDGEEYSHTSRDFDESTEVPGTNTKALVGGIISSAIVLFGAIVVVACYKIPHLRRSWARVYSDISTRWRGDDTSSEPTGRCNDVEAGAPADATPLNRKPAARESRSTVTVEARDHSSLLHKSNNDREPTQPSAVMDESSVTVCAKQRESRYCVA